jgi:hypothetical protein
MYLDQDLVDAIAATPPYTLNTMSRTRNDKDGLLALGAANGSDPIVESSFLETTSRRASSRGSTLESMRRRRLSCSLLRCARRKAAKRTRSPNVCCAHKCRVTFVNIQRYSRRTAAPWGAWGISWWVPRWLSHWRISQTWKDWRGFFWRSGLRKRGLASFGGSKSWLRLSKCGRIVVHRQGCHREKVEQPIMVRAVDRK